MSRRRDNRVSSSDESSDEDEVVSDYSDSDEQEEEFSVTKYEKNIHPSAVRLLEEISGLTEAQISLWLHTCRLVTQVEDVYDDILKYVANSQEHNYGLKVLNIFRVARQQEIDFPKDGKLRMLLWHGTKTQFVPAILEYGFKPPASNGQMFGAGIYFADRASKSANYCGRMSPGVIGYMFLCDVVVGEWYNAKNPKNEFTTAPEITAKNGKKRPCDSVKCTGENVPDKEEQKKVGGMVIPNGKTIKNARFTQYTVRYNEFIVYEANKCKPKYLVKVECTQNKVPFNSN